MIQKTIQDYYETLAKEYPNIPIQDIKRICQYGWKSLYLHNSYGGDVLLRRRDFWFYSGKLMNNSLKFFDYYVRKMRIKLRILYKRYKIEWDGYYYFALSQTQYEDYLSQKNSRGRPRKNFKFGKVILYKIYDECSIIEHAKIALFRVKMKYDKGFTLYEENYITGDSELIQVREPLKFEDILLSKYNYQYISDSLRKYKKNG